MTIRSCSRSIVPPVDVDPRLKGQQEKLRLEAEAWGNVTDPERSLLRHFADRADLIAPFSRCGEHGVVGWLLVPLSPAQLDLLAQFETDDREEDCDAEDERRVLAEWAPDWRPDLFNPEKVVQFRRRRAAWKGGVA
ncbi:hypothetical protein [uncultured Reyranella sp.]|jgi:hypothetical protein|uniref:hypothetical protein n=1 Tax=uncultured Reyranella sp. TaxID=735512 RepID=UPI00259CD8E5|nr:hypothetical protein [uncultured Reyranella sp.]